MDYKSTLNLPKTKFPMQANLKKKEHEILNLWNKIKIYTYNNHITRTFTLNDGPPYANGDIHMGHAFNKILKDIVCKFKKINGYNINFVPGWDCHGLPIELNVEKKINTFQNIICDNKFRIICKSYATIQINIQKKSFIQLGINTNWNDVYKTMDFNFEASIIKNFKQMLSKNYIYLGYKPIYWCFDCSSALAESEIEYYIKQSLSIYTLFQFDTNPFLKKTEINLIIWTTTPWTLPFNEAVAINEKFLYILFNNQNKSYIINKDLFYLIIKKTNLKKIKILKIFKASRIQNSTINHPFYKKQIKLILSDHVKNDSGTGCVHIAPAYGYDDYKLGLKNKIKIKNSITETGFLNKNIIFLKNEHITKTNKNILQLIKKNKKLFLLEIIKHKYPYCWRHKTILIFRTTKQWFFNINNKALKKNILTISKKKITWTPKNGYIKMKNMLKHRLDWCISRQRIWGVPIMLFINKNNKLHKNSIDILTKTITLTSKYGTNFWYKKNIFKLLSIDKSRYTQITDVLDVWFDSSAVYEYISTTKKKQIPLNLCIEGSDQYRGWFQVSLINSITNYNLAPYKNILTHGFILDKDGRKMSKSLRNIVSPNNIIKTYGAEILRLWVSSVNYQFDINYSNETLKRICEAYRKIRNTLRFMLANINEIKIKKTQIYIKMLNLDSWILYKLFLLKKNIKKYNRNYEFFKIYKAINNFCIDNLGSKYFEIIKDKLYTTNSISRKSCQITLCIILYNLIKLLAPILSFTAEEVWQYINFKDKKSVFLSNYKINLIYINNIYFKIKNTIFLEKIFNLKNLINQKIEKYKNDNKISTTLELKIIIYCNIFWYKILNKITKKKDAVFILIISKMKLKKTLKNNLKITITTTKLKKCDRCWNRHLKVTSKLNICKKCINNLYYNTSKKIFV